LNAEMVSVSEAIARIPQYRTRLSSYIGKVLY
jgi:hypothetical protein